MRRESHVRFCEGGGVRFPSATRLARHKTTPAISEVIINQWDRRLVRRAKPARCSGMKKPHGEGVAIRAGPESCGDLREEAPKR
jgi:hypothetical protein